MQIHCAGCHAPIPAADVDPDAGLVTCPACHRLCRLPADASAAAPGLAPQRGVPRAAELSEEDGGRAFVLRWRSPLHVFGAIFCVAWSWLLPRMLGAVPGKAWQVIEYALMLPLVAFGAALAYFSAAGLVNRTRVGVADGALDVRHGPLPWPGNRRIPLGELDEVYVERRSVTRRERAPVMYAVLALLKDERRVTLFGGLRDSAEAAQAADRLSEWLGVHSTR